MTHADAIKVAIEACRDATFNKDGYELRSHWANECREAAARLERLARFVPLAIDAARWLDQCDDPVRSYGLNDFVKAYRSLIAEEPRA